MFELPVQFRQFYTAILPRSVRLRLEYTLRGPYPKEFDRRKFIFIHIPKTAGKSLTKIMGTGGACHLSWRHYENILKEQIHQYYVFTIVRDPLDRLISSYTYMSKGGNHSREDLSIKKKWIAPYKDFNTFIKESLTRSEVIQSRKFRPQSTFLETRDKNIASPIHIYRFENLENDYKKIMSNIGFTGQSLPHINASPRKADYFISERSAEIINKIYATDFENFHYRKASSSF